ncbi:lamin tail domain-containing protein [Actinoplanes sp. N902-109]|uniref:lamin tail domain-containing protein n=1 Tax=Actinoplanes sp. (strain N902-109) TaxID=649831 RepID=UPI00032966B0|nr:lamin tail domain-containing protein [Actinoplanes sp. N902-109]AGL20759.1 hypothetical protein L083_7249 [Actinoplanes sp. N902-109]
MFRALSALVGCLAAAGLAAPASAATTPTVSAPASRSGYGPITLTGMAAPGAKVELYESAYVFDDFYPAPDYDTGGYVTTTASSAGKWSLNRIIDSGFRFYVVSDGVVSAHIKVAMGIVPKLTVRNSGNRLTFGVTVDPAQPNLRVHIQRGRSGVWTDLAGGYTSDPAATFSATVADTSGWFRAVVDADTENNLLRGQTPTVTYNIVRFTKIQYKGAEYVRLGNAGTTTVNLNGWTVRDAANHVYRFATPYNLGAGKAVYVHTGKGTTSGQHRYWNRSSVWNDGGDTAILRDAAGTTIDTCRWGAGSGSTTC